MWVGLADRGAGRFDDIVLGRRDKTVAYQVKTSRDPEPFSLATLLFGSENLLETMLDSRARLTDQEPLRVVEMVYACDDYPRTTDNLVDDEQGLDSAEFLRFHENHGRTYSLDDWRTSRYGAFIESIQKASRLNGNNFETFWQNTRFKTGSAARELRNAMSPKDKRRIADLAALLPRLVADAADKDRWSLQELLERLGWPDPFALRHLHTFPVDALYASNAKTQGDLTTALTTLSSGYIAVVGPPGSGKSTLLAAGVLPTPKAFVLRYLAFIPNESQGLGRAEAVSFLHDIVKQLKRTGLGGHFVPGSELDELRVQLDGLLIEAGQRFADRGVRTVIVVDGLDHVSREEKPDRSFLTELPLPGAVPSGVIFVLGAQKLELPDISTSVRDQAATEGRLIEIAPLTRDAVNRLAELAEIPADVDRQELYSKTEGHPLSTRYVLDGLKRAADAQERRDWLHSGPAYGGDVDVFYRRALHDIEGNDSAQLGLAYLALAESSMSLPSLDQAIGRPAVDALMKAAGYLLKVDRNRCASIFHNSFRLFLRAELFVRHGARDDDRIRTHYRELASMAKGAKEDDPQHWMELRYCARAEDYKEVAALATPAVFREQFKQGRSAQEIRNDLSLCFRAVAELRNPKMLLEVIFAGHELNMRVENLGDEVFEAYIALGDLEYAKRMLRGADVQLSEGKGFELVHSFLRDRDADEARETFEFLEPLEELLGTKQVGNRPSDKALESWAEVALAFREPARFLASLARLQPADGWGREPIDLAPFRTKLKLLAARGQLDRHPEMGAAELAKSLEIEAQHLGILQFLAVRSAFDSGHDMLAERRLQEARKNADALAPVNLRQLAAVAWNLGRPDIAQELTEKVGGAPTFAIERTSLHAEDRDLIARQIILHASLRSRLKLAPDVGQTPKSRIFALLQTHLEALGSTLGNVLSGHTEGLEQTFRFSALLDFLERARAFLI